MNPQRNNSLEFKYEVDAKYTFRSPCLKSKIQISGWKKKKKTLLVLNIVKKLPINWICTNTPTPLFAGGQRFKRTFARLNARHL